MVEAEEVDAVVADGEWHSVDGELRIACCVMRDGVMRGEFEEFTRGSVKH
jgi:hypothetical protein